MPESMQIKTGEIGRLPGARFSLTKSVVICLTLLLASSLLALALLPRLAGGQAPLLSLLSQSENYRITADVLSEGGGPGSSSSYQVVDSLGEAVETGTSSSTSFRLCSGIACVWKEGPPPNFITITAPANNAVTMTASITVAGQTAPNASVTVSLDESTYTTTAQNSGAYAVTGVALPPGANFLDSRSVDQYGNRAVATVGITRTTYFIIGTLLSRIHDAGQITTTWETITWQANIPAGTDLVLRTRTGDTPTPDNTWSDWSGVYTTIGQAISSPAGRYIQYQAIFSTTDPTITPVLDAVSITYSSPTSCVAQITPSFTEVYGSVTLNGIPAPVGAVVQAISSRGDTVGCFTVATAGQYGLMRLYGEDLTANPPIPGMRPGELVAFRVNGAPAVATPPFYWHDDHASHRVDLAASGIEGQSILVNPGWNLISLRVEPLAPLVNQVLNFISGRYDRVLGETGVYVPSLPDVYNTLKELHSKQGYYLRLTGSTSANLLVEGPPQAANTPIPLHQGWNWIGYLPTSTLPITVALQSIDGHYQRVLSLDKTYDPSLPEFSTLREMQPGEGYLLYASDPVTLTYPTGGAGAPAVQPSTAEAACTGIAPTPYLTLLYGHITVNGRSAPVGTRVDILTPRGEVAGCFVVGRAGQYGMVHVYGVDNTAQPPIGGFQEGEPLRFRVNRVELTSAIPLAWQDDKTPHEVDLAVRLYSIYLPLILKSR